MKTKNRHFYTQLLYDYEFRALIGLAYGAFNLNEDIKLAQKNNARFGSNSNIDEYSGFDHDLNDQKI